MAGSLGMSTGPLLGGLIYDRFDGYALMYVVSCVMGLAATATLLSFRPISPRDPEPVPA
jgi:MFS family permease